MAGGKGRHLTEAASLGYGSYEWVFIPIFRPHWGIMKADAHWIGVFFDQNCVNIPAEDGLTGCPGLGYISKIAWRRSSVG